MYKIGRAKQTPIQFIEDALGRVQAADYKKEVCSGGTCVGVRKSLIFALANAK